jgi:hypothetical protein
MLRFTILDAQLRNHKDHKKTVSRQKVKPIFVGSPVRPVTQGGVMTEAQIRKRQVANCEEDIDAKLRNMKNTVEQTGSLSLYSFMNDIGINRIRDRVNPSNSIALTKA